MADGLKITEGTGPTVETDDVGGKHLQVVKLNIGAPNASIPWKGSDEERGAYVDVRPGFSVLSQLFPGNSTSPYAAGDVIGTATNGGVEMPGVPREESYSVVINRILISDKAKQNAPIDLVIMNGVDDLDFFGASDNEPFDLPDNGYSDIEAVVRFLATDYIDFNDNSVAIKQGLNLRVAPSEDKLQVFLIARSAVTYTSTTDVGVIIQYFQE